MKRPSFKVTCPNCGNTLGVMEDEVLAVRKKGRLVRLTVWEEAEITCEDCGNVMTLTRIRDAKVKEWNGMVDSRKWETEEK